MKRRIRGRGSIETLPSGAERARIRGVGLDGRPYDLKETFPTRDLAERALESFKRIAYNLEAGIGDTWTRETLAQFVERERAARHFPWRKNDGFAWKLLAPLHARRFIELDAARVLAWARGLAADGYSFGSVNVAFVVLARAVKLALAHQVIPRAPWGEVTPAWRELFEGRAARPRDALTPEQWETLWTAARDLAASGAGGPLADLDLRVSTLRHGALRPVEVCRLRHADLDVAHGTVYLREIAKKKKKSDGAHVPIGRELAARLAAHVDAMPPAARATGWLFPMLGADGRRDVGRLKWVGRERSKYMAFVSKAERDALRALGVTWDLYSTRHTAATEALVAGGMEAAAKTLRHEDQRSIGGYVHLRPEHFGPMVDAMDDLDRALPHESKGQRLEELATLAERIDRGDLAGLDATELPEPTGGDRRSSRGPAGGSGSSRATATRLQNANATRLQKEPRPHGAKCNCRRCQIKRSRARSQALQKTE